MCRSRSRYASTRLTKRQVLIASGFTLPTAYLFAGRFGFSEFLQLYNIAKTTSFNTYTLHV